MNVSEIRQRYLDALGAGKSIKEATAIANGAAVPRRDAGKIDPPDNPSNDDLAAVRAEYERVVGKKPFHGWEVAALREKIAAAGQ